MDKEPSGGAKAEIAGQDRFDESGWPGDSQLMQKLNVSNPTLNLWRRRYQEEGIGALVKGKTRAPGTPALPQQKVQEVLTLTGKPTGATH